MKTRKNFKPIIVNNKKYLYSVSLAAPNYEIFIYDEEDRKYVIKIQSVEFPKDFQHSTWRGKHKDGMWGKREIEYIIKNIL